MYYYLFSPCRHCVISHKRLKVLIFFFTSYPSLVVDKTFTSLEVLVSHSIDRY